MSRLSFDYGSVLKAVGATNLSSLGDTYSELEAKQDIAYLNFIEWDEKTNKPPLTAVQEAERAKRKERMEKRSDKFDDKMWLVNELVTLEDGVSCQIRGLEKKLIKRKSKRQLELRAPYSKFAYLRKALNENSLTYCFDN